MAEIVKETTVVQNEGPKEAVTTEVKHVATNTQTIEYLMYFFFGVLEFLLAFRLIFRLLGASTASGFVRLIYGITGIFILPFEGIFSRAVAPGIETVSVFEPSTLVAMVVYALLVWGLVKLVRVLSGEKQAI